MPKYEIVRALFLPEMCTRWPKRLIIKQDFITHVINYYYVKNKNPYKKEASKGQILSKRSAIDGYTVIGLDSRFLIDVWCIDVHICIYITIHISMVIIWARTYIIMISKTRSISKMHGNIILSTIYNTYNKYTGWFAKHSHPLFHLQQCSYSKSDVWRCVNKFEYFRITEICCTT